MIVEHPLKFKTHRNRLKCRTIGFDARSIDRGLNMPSTSSTRVLGMDSRPMNGQILDERELLRVKHTRDQLLSWRPGSELLSTRCYEPFLRSLRSSMSSTYVSHGRRRANLSRSE